MARNQKLAPLLAGRAVAAVEPPPRSAPGPASRFAPSGGSTWHVRFGDGSTLAVRTDGTVPQGGEAAGGGEVVDVTQSGTTLTLTLGGGGDGARALVFRTAEASGCVMLRGGDGGMEYAD